jgi:DNA-binding NarL/FixJ family response regulator
MLLPARWGCIGRMTRPRQDGSRTPATSSDVAIRVLLVDDHLVVRRGLHDFLGAQTDIEVVGEAADGRAGFDAVERLDADGRPPDVVLMDLVMEPVDGIEATRLIRTRFADVEVVALTAFGERERVLAALDAGASGYLLKDADAQQVASAIRAAHRGALQLDPLVARRLMARLTGPSAADVAARLTVRERDVLRLVAAGKPNKEIAADLVITERTARTHVSNILRKLGLASRTQAALWATREGYADAP